MAWKLSQFGTEYGVDQPDKITTEMILHTECSACDVPSTGYIQIHPYNHKAVQPYKCRGKGVKRGFFFGGSPTREGGNKVTETTSKGGRPVRVWISRRRKPNSIRRRGHDGWGQKTEDDRVLSYPIPRTEYLPRTATTHVYMHYTTFRRVAHHFRLQVTWVDGRQVESTMCKKTTWEEAGKAVLPVDSV